jgi:hypothetical protein
MTFGQKSLAETTINLSFCQQYIDQQLSYVQTKWRHAIQYNDAQQNDIQHNDIQQNNMKHNDTQQNDIQHNDTQHNDNQHNNIQRINK